jgi:hypothetical protein
MRSRKVLARCKSAIRDGFSVITSSLVIAELCRGPRYDAAIHNAVRIHQINVYEVDYDQAVSIGHILGREHLDSCYIVDASVIQLALGSFASEIITADPADINRLKGYVSSNLRTVTI